MTAEDDFNDILLPDEKVLWSGRPDWEKAELRKSGWREKSGAIKFATGMFASIVAMMAFGMVVDPEGFAGVMLGFLIMLSAISFVLALLSIFDQHDPKQIRHDHIYAVTTNRLVIHDRSKLTTRSFMGPIIFEIATVQNGSVMDLNFRYYPEDDFATLYALSEAATPQKLLIKDFSRRKAEK